MSTHHELLRELSTRAPVLLSSVMAAERDFYARDHFTDAELEQMVGLVALAEGVLDTARRLTEAVRSASIWTPIAVDPEAPGGPLGLWRYGEDGGDHAYVQADRDETFSWWAVAGGRKAGPCKGLASRAVAEMAALHWLSLESRATPASEPPRPRDTRMDQVVGCYLDLVERGVGRRASGALSTWPPGGDR